MVLLEIFLSFLKIGFTSFGGATMVPLVNAEMLSHGWMTAEEVGDIVAIAEMTPGPIAVNSATFVGYNLFGVAGGILCTLCTIAIPFVIALTVAVYFTRFKDNKYLKDALSGIRPVVIGVIAASCLSVAKISITDLYSLLFFGVALFMVWKCKINPIITLITCGGLGAIFYGWLLPLLGL